MTWKTQYSCDYEGHLLWSCRLQPAAACYNYENKHKLLLWVTWDVSVSAAIIPHLISKCPNPDAGYSWSHGVMVRTSRLRPPRQRLWVANTVPSELQYSQYWNAGTWKLYCTKYSNPINDNSRQSLFTFHPFTRFTPSPQSPYTTLDDTIMSF